MYGARRGPRLLVMGHGSKWALARQAAAVSTAGRLRRRLQIALVYLGASLPSASVRPSVRPSSRRGLTPSVGAENEWF